MCIRDSAWITYLFYAVLSSLFSYVLMNFIDPDLIVMAKEVSIEAIEKMSGLLGEDGVQAAIEKIENENPFGIQQTLMSIAITPVSYTHLAAERADVYCNHVKPIFETIRYHCDKLELLVDDEMWTLAKYRELLFTR